MNNTQKVSTKTLKKITLVAYFSLLIYMPLWLIVLSDSSALSAPLTLIMFVLPLLLPIKGLVQGNPYTYAWSNFIVMIYFLHSLTTLWVSADEKLWALAELLLATIMFIAASYYAKYRGQELGLSIRK
ncbi:Uncharacterized membrane protein [Colwellia chukchiensis]|uniref:Uncharacterized membrane protein n=1 Tax=Colwellia chukchiensis TaxID=641665 RepID=A0A1H7LZV1_9GAMM|nr:DUF2069 domain-containing protein [Colwellia chukchiensis]SEL04550.1 Uncharacterized membrane protein [Colwellia chukchiensis]